MFAPNSPELAAALQFTLQAALQRWLGDVIEVRALEVDAARSRRCASTLEYIVRRTGEAQTAIVRRERRAMTGDRAARARDPAPRDGAPRASAT